MWSTSPRIVFTMNHDKRKWNRSQRRPLNDDNRVSRDTSAEKKLSVSVCHWNQPNVYQCEQLQTGADLVVTEFHDAHWTPLTFPVAVDIIRRAGWLHAMCVTTMQKSTAQICGNIHWTNAHNRIKQKTKQKTPCTVLIVANVLALCYVVYFYCVTFPSRDRHRALYHVNRWANGSACEKCREYYILIFLLYFFCCWIFCCFYNWALMAEHQSGRRIC